MADIELDNLIIRDFKTSAGFQAAVESGEIGENDLSFTPYEEPAKPDLSNTTDNVDFVVESQLPTEANGYTWYRKYKSGWVEQGGPASTSSSSITITFPVVMSNAQYTAVLGNRSGTYEQLRINSRSATNMVVNTTIGTGSASCLWQVIGIAA